MKALVLAGGRGTRLRPITTTLNKHLIPIAGKPMIFRVIDDIVECGIREVIINVNKGDTEIPSIVGDGARWGITIHYIEQPEPNGMMYPILLAEHLLGDEPFILFAGDNILSGGIKQYYQEFIQSDADAHLLVTKVRNPERFGVAVVHDGVMVQTVEKPSDFISDLAVTAVYFYRKPIIEAMKQVKPVLKGNSSTPEYYPPIAHQWMIDNGYKITTTEVTGWWKDTGKPAALLEGNGLVLESIQSDIQCEIPQDLEMQGKIQIGRGTKIGKNVVLRGPITIGSNCDLQNCYIGPYSSIGNNVIIQGAEIENSIVFNDVRIHCERRIVDSLLGARAIVSDHKESFPNGHKLIIGDNTIVQL